MKIWLVDANSYHKEISADLQKIKQDYFIIKNHVRQAVLGEHITPKAMTYSLGLLRIGTILKHNLYNVEYVHFQNIAQKIITEQPPDIMAFSAVCPTIPMCHSFVEKLKKHYPSTIFVLGGSQVNVAERITKSKFPLFDRYAAGYDTEGAEKIVQKQLATPKEPYVDFSLLPYPLTNYAINTCSTIGCQYSCKYCQDHLIPHCKISPNGFIPYFMEQLPKGTCIHFFDSVLGGSKQGLIQVCKELSQYAHGFLLSCDIRAEWIDKDVLNALNHAGFVEIRMGVETADEAVLTRNNRSLKTNTLRNALSLCRNNSDLYLTLYSAIGLPGTTPHSLSLTKDLFTDFLSTRAVDEIKTCLFVPYPLDVERYTPDEIKIISENWSDYDRQSSPVFDLPHLSSDQLWHENLDLAQKINEAWLKGLNITSIEALPNIKYGEYNIENYSI